MTMLDCLFFFSCTDCDIVIENDSSISRQHAIIRVGGNSKVGTGDMSITV